MKRIVFLLCFIVLGKTGIIHAQGTDMMRSVTGRYWVYDNSVWDADHNVVYTFLERMNEGQVLAKGTGIYLDDTGLFKEVADTTKIGGKPCSGSWQRENDHSLKVNCGGSIWYYTILELKEGAMVLRITKQPLPAKSK